MLKEINKLILSTKGEASEVYNKIISIAAKIEKETLVGKDFVLINVEEMESWVSPDKVDEEIGLGKVELEL
jgi:hypothetical protein